MIHILYHTLASKAVLGIYRCWEKYYIDERVAKNRGFINKPELKISWNRIWVSVAGHLYKPRVCPEKKQGYEGDPEQTITPVYEADIDL
jgi:hypothetical protein